MDGIPKQRESKTYPTATLNIVGKFHLTSWSEPKHVLLAEGGRTGDRKLPVKCVGYFLPFAIHLDNLH